MTLPQIESLAIVAGMLVLFVSDRLRYDLVGASALSVAALLGVVPAHKAFSGFSSPVVIIIASVLVISRAVAVSGVVDGWMRIVLRRLDSTTLQVGALTAAVTLLSAFVKNVGALGVFMPVAIQAAEQPQPPDLPLSHAAGLRFADWRHHHADRHLAQHADFAGAGAGRLGQPYGLFDYTSIGLPLALVSIVFLSFGWRLLPTNRRGQRSAEKRFAIEDYTSEALLPDGSPLSARPSPTWRRWARATISVAAIIREQSHRYVPRAHWTLFADDILVLQGDPTALQPVIDQARLQLLNAEQIEECDRTARTTSWRRSRRWSARNPLLVGRTPQSLHLRRTYEVNVIAIRSGRRPFDAAGRAAGSSRATWWRSRDRPRR